MSVVTAMQVARLVRAAHEAADELNELRAENADLRNEVAHLRNEARKYARRVVKSGRD